MRLFEMIFKTLWSLHNELIWLGLPNYTDHISLPLHVQILTANGFLCCCALCPVMPIFCFFVCHHVKTEVWPHISCNQTLLYYRFCRLAFLAPQLQKSGKIAIRVFGGLTDTVLHLNAHLKKQKFSLFFVDSEVSLFRRTVKLILTVFGAQTQRQFYGYQAN